METIFIVPPDDFSPSLEAAGCYCAYGDTILMLKRQADKPFGNTWGIPGGKLEKGETPRVAVIREIYEEVGLSIDSEDLQQIGAMYMRLTTGDFIFHIFAKRFTIYPEISLRLQEHQAARWVSIDEALALPLIFGGPEALHIYTQTTSKASQGTGLKAAENQRPQAS